MRTCVVVSCLLVNSLWAQSESANITGVVTDASGALLTRVTVSLANEGTGAVTSIETGESGRYFVSGLRPGIYTVSAARSGFKKSVNAGLTLQVNQTARLDIALAIGDVTEQITVSAEASILETETSGRGAVIDGRKIVELPLNGRDYNLLAQLAPGVLPATPRLQSIGFKGAFNVNGNRAFQNAFLLDGVDNTSYSNSFRGGNTQIVQPSIDALQEFKIQTNAYGAGTHRPGEEGRGQKCGSTVEEVRGQQRHRAQEGQARQIGRGIVSHARPARVLPIGVHTQELSTLRPVC